MSKRQTIDGDLYYSPNAVDIVPLDFSMSPSHNPFFKEKQAGTRVIYRDLLCPRWWSMAFGWTSFVPTKQCLRSSASSMLLELATRPQIQVFTSEDGESRGYGISPSCRWPSLEKDVYTAVVTLKNKFHIPCVLPTLPHIFGYANKYASRSTLEAKIVTSREWFLVWLGALGYLIAWVQRPSDSTVRIHSSYPEWRTVLEAAGLSSSWIDDVLYSPICNYPMANPRVGCILNLLEPTPGQPSVRWLVEHGIPVWYRWGPAEEERASEDEDFQKLAPPPERQRVILSTERQDVSTDQSGERMAVEATIQTTGEAATTGAGGIALDVDSPYPQQDQEPVEPTQDVQPSLAYTLQIPEWVTFFEKREENNMRLLAKEGVEEKTRRENRLREPPTSSAKVFVWERSDNPSLLYERVPVLVRFRSDTLGTYGLSQKRYDPVSNEWDCCDEFGEPDEDPDSDDSGRAELEETMPDDTSTRLTVEVGSPTKVDPPSLAELDHRPTEMVDQSITSPLALALQGHFHIHCGFSPPVPGTSAVTLDGPQHTPQSQKFVFQMGNIPPEHQRSNDEYLKSTMFSALHAFFHSIANRCDPPEGTWDIKDTCPEFVCLTNRYRRIKFIQIPSRDGVNVKESFRAGLHHYYLFTSKHPSERWTFATLSASAALLASRLPQEYTDYEIAYFFAQRAIPFRIFHPLQILVPRHPHAPIHHVIPIRPHNHTFNKADYEAYVRMRTMLLGQTHMQGALRRGGIAWRLAIGTLGLNAVTQRPSLYNEFQEIFVCKEVLVEDVLTETELDLLCGGYECFSSNGKDRALKSWWPLVRLFEKEEAGYNLGFWSEANEEWYATRLRQIEVGEATPHTYTEWKSLLRGSKLTRSFLTYVEKRSRDVLNV